MVKSKTNKIHLEVKNDVELDVVNDSISKRNRLVEKKRSVSSKRRMLQSFNPRFLLIL